MEINNLDKWENWSKVKLMMNFNMFSEVLSDIQSISMSESYYEHFTFECESSS